MGSNFEKRWLRPIAAILTMLTVLAGIGYILHRKIDDLLYSYIELQINRQVQILAKDLEGRVADRELAGLGSLARAVERVEQWNMKEASGIDDVRSIDTDPSKGRYGIIDHSGNALYGSRIDVDKFPSIRQAFHGEPAVSGNYKDGWIAATPVMSSGSAATARAPIASMSAKFCTIAFLPTSSGVDQSRRKCLPSTSMSVVANT